MKETILTILLLVAVVCLVSAQFGGIGYGLYLWANGTALAAAAWTGFKLWLTLSVSGLAAYISALILGVFR